MDEETSQSTYPVVTNLTQSLQGYLNHAGRQIETIHVHVACLQITQTHITIMYYIITVTQQRVHTHITYFLSFRREKLNFVMEM